MRRIGIGCDVDQAALLAAVEKISPLIKEHADRGERERHLMDPVVEALRDVGLYRMLVPRRLGGLRVDPLTFYHVVEALPRVDGSAGWCMFNSGGLPISTAFLPDDAADEIFAKAPHTIMSGTVFPPGRAIPSPGGYLVSGADPWPPAVCLERAAPGGIPPANLGVGTVAPARSARCDGALLAPRPGRLPFHYSGATRRRDGHDGRRATAAGSLQES